MTKNRNADSDNEGRERLEVDIDRMVNEGLGGGLVAEDENGLIEDTTTDTLNKVGSIVEENSCTDT